MLIKFEQLCKKLEINSSNPSGCDLKKLINWCESNVSTDVYFSGELQERFDFYKAYIIDFLEYMQPNINANSSDLVQDMTALQYIAYKGLNVYMLSLIHI